MIKLFSPVFNELEIQSAKNTIKSGFWASGQGVRNVLKFEKKFEKYTNSQECVAVDSGTAALHLALKVLDINKKEVLVPTLTFVSTIHAIKYNGGIPVFVDVSPDTLCIDLIDLQKKITKKSKVILPVHFGGYPSNIEEINKIAKKKSLNVVEDAAHACGTTENNQKIGSHSDFVCFSFHPVKNLAMPKGGAICINHKKAKMFKTKLNSLRWCGISNRKGVFYDISELGFNYYMDEISAGIGLEQLKKLDKLNKKRFNIAKRYNTEIKNVEKIPLNKDCNYHLYWILVKNRDQFMKKMQQNKIETGIHYTPVNSMSFYKSSKKLPITSKIGKEIVTIPIHPNLASKQISHIINTVNKLTN